MALVSPSTLLFTAFHFINLCAPLRRGNYAYFERRHEIMLSEESLRLTYFSKGAFDAIVAKERTSSDIQSRILCGGSLRKPRDVRTASR
jgi:hypothetical protein